MKPKMPKIKGPSEAATRPPYAPIMPRDATAITPPAGASLYGVFSRPAQRAAPNGAPRRTLIGGNS